MSDIQNGDIICIGHRCDDDQFEVFSGAMVGQCSSCQKYCFIDNLMNEKTNKNKAKLFCNVCFEELQNTDEFSCFFLNSDDASKVIEDIEDKGVEEAKKLFFNKLLLKRQSDIDQQVSDLNKGLPQICSFAVGRLRPWENPIDLILARTISLRIEEYLLDRHSCGIDLFPTDWSEKDIMVVIRFLFSVVKAAHDTKEKFSSHNDILDIIVKDLEENYEHWDENLFNDENEDWEL